MGIAIILLTIAIRSAVFPLTNVSYRSFAKMKKVSPQVLEMRKTFGDDKKGLQQELVKLYEESLAREDADERFALTVVANVVLNLDAVLTK